MATRTIQQAAVAAHHAAIEAKRVTSGARSNALR
jgi:hypothetical protein